MRDWINILIEAEAKTKDKIDTLLPDVTVDSGEIVPSRGTDTAPIVHGHTANASSTASKAIAAQRNMNVSPELWSDAAAIASTQGDIISDEEARAIAGGGEVGVIELPRTPETLPMIIQNNIVASGEEDFDPEWHQVKHLPGYLMSGIRIVAREVFSRFTTTPIEEIQMMCTLLNPENDVKKMMAWIGSNGVKEDEMTFDFSQYMRGYTAHIQLWRVDGFQFALCRDIGGMYIYGWPGNNREITDRSEPDMKSLPSD